MVSKNKSIKCDRARVHVEIVDVDENDCFTDDTRRGKINAKTDFLQTFR